MNNAVSIFLLLVLMIAPVSTLAEDDHDEGEHDEHSEELHFDEKQLREFDIIVAKAQPGVIEQHIAVPGEIVVNQETRSHISARFPGIVKEVKKRIGDNVSQGAVLAVIESNESLAPYEITALMDGTVIDKDATPGELLKEEDVAFTIADLSTVWVDLTIYQTDLASIKVGQSVHLSLGHGQAEQEGKISYLSPVVNEQTRTAVARIVLPNPDGAWRPGLFVTGQIKVSEKMAKIRIPQSAVEMVEGKPSVFVKTSEGFKPQPVKFGIQTDKFAEVLIGLAPGEEYVSKHGFTLKTALVKESFGDDHDH